MSRSDAGNTPENAAAQMKAKATEMAGNVREAATQQYEKARDVATEQYENLREQATEYYQSGREKAVELRDQVEEYVREQPVKAILMAAGVGVVLGVLWRRS